MTMYMQVSVALKRKYIVQMYLSQICLMLCGALSVGVASCPYDTYLQALDKNVSKCCEMCPPGHHVERSCDLHNGTSCKPCEPGTFMDTKTSSRECKKCLVKCEPSQIIQRPCNTTHNTECGCKKGEYLHKETFMCTLCSSCKKGFGVKTKCSTYGNTVCQPCPPGTFSSKDSTTEKCHPCTLCLGNQNVLRKCTAKLNRICSNKTTETTSQPLTDKPIFIKSTDTRDSSNKVTIYIPVAVLVLILVCVTAGSVYWYKTRNAAPNPHDEAVNRDEELQEGEELLPVPSQICVTRETQPRARSSRGLRGRKKQRHATERGNVDASSSGSSSSLQGNTDGEIPNGRLLHKFTVLRLPLVPKRLVRDLSYDTILNIASLLNPKQSNDWRKLAARLGYNQVEVDNFAIDPRESTQSLLRDWGTRDTSTVELLHQHLVHMRRNDAAKLLLNKIKVQCHKV